MKLYLIQGTIDFTDMSDSFAQEELEEMKSTGMTDTQAKKLADDLGVAVEGVEGKDGNIIDEADIIQQVKDSSYIGTKEDLINNYNIPENVFDSNLRHYDSKEEMLEDLGKMRDNKEFEITCYFYNKKKVILYEVQKLSYLITILNDMNANNFDVKIRNIKEEEK